MPGEVRVPLPAGWVFLTAHLSLAGPPADSTARLGVGEKVTVTEVSGLTPSGRPRLRNQPRRDLRWQSSEPWS